MAGTDVDTFRTAWVPVNAKSVLLKTPNVCTAVYVLVCSLINEKTSPVLVELLSLYNINLFFKHLYYIAKKYDNHKQTLKRLPASVTQWAAV